MRSPLAAYNERVKLLAGFLNALALGLIGFAVLRPLTDPALSVDVGTLWWGLAGLAIHGFAYYVLRYLRSEMPE